MELQILANILKFLEKSKSDGIEAYAWVEAHQYLQTKINQLATSQVAAGLDTKASNE